MISRRDKSPVVFTGRDWSQREFGFWLDDFFFIWSLGLDAQIFSLFPRRRSIFERGAHWVVGSLSAVPVELWDCCTEKIRRRFPIRSLSIKPCLFVCLFAFRSCNGVWGWGSLMFWTFYVWFSLPWKSTWQTSVVYGVRNYPPFCWGNVISVRGNKLTWHRSLLSYSTHYCTHK